MKSLHETLFLKDKYEVHKIFTGGEPTLWADGEKKITDILVETAALGFEPTLVTNGRAFCSVESTEEFITSFTDRTNAPLMVVLSADYWHGNVDSTGHCIAIENLLAARERILGQHSNLCVGVAWTFSTRLADAPSDQFRHAYGNRVNLIQCFPLTPIGRGHNLEDIAPKLQPNSCDKSSSGAFAEILIHRAVQRGWIQKTEEFARLENSVIMNECTSGNGSLFLYTDGNYYTCADGIGRDPFKICRVGEMNEETMDLYFDARPAFKLIQHLGPIGLLNQIVETRPDVGEIANHHHCFGISGRGGCMIHRELIDRGIFPA